MARFDIDLGEIRNMASFHEVFGRTLKFFDGYGRNMDAWIDCMTSVDAVADGLTTVTVPRGELLVLRIDDPLDFKRRCPEQYDALIECSAFVKFRRADIVEPPVLALLLNGRYEPRYT